ncbi:hypothetical protein [Endozoicomonas euniceicola]|uniref:DUF5666 domain-containing protein n=1 Tax=Endozoicomonas euniceicola TaxID=1234143 RepID=A0ABY6H082_9GAMM|nr:hypothetical protein [Endozoicomonas euniceicola]UYM18453.1 hypothetical protein NX720_11305 [Endozoicomonas euniceicola]
MMLFKKIPAILAMSLIPTLAIACPYSKPNNPQPPAACSIPDGVYVLSGTLSTASNYTMLAFVQDASARILIKDKAGNSDFIITSKRPKRGPRHHRRGMTHASGGPDAHGHHHRGGHGKHRRPGGHGKKHGRPVMCQGNQIKVCFGPESKKAIATPKGLTGSMQLTHSNGQLSGSITLNGSLNGKNDVQLIRQNR